MSTVLQPLLCRHCCNHFLCRHKMSTSNILSTAQRNVVSHIKSRRCTRKAPVFVYVCDKSPAWRFYCWNVRHSKELLKRVGGKLGKGQHETAGERRMIHPVCSSLVAADPSSLTPWYDPKLQTELETARYQVRAVSTKKDIACDRDKRKATQSNSGNLSTNKICHGNTKKAPKK